MNIVTQLIGFISLALLLNRLSLTVLGVLILLASFYLWRNKNAQYFRLLRRLKWFFIVTFLVFVFNTPGEHFTFWVFEPSPSYEGLTAATTQMLRLALMLAFISHILAVNSREQLIAGLFFLLQPLQYLKLDVERFAVRLWLTLYYVEVVQLDSPVKQPLMMRFEQMVNLNVESNIESNVESKNGATSHAIEEVVLAYPQFNWLDFFMLTIISIVLIVSWLRVFD